MNKRWARIFLAAMTVLCLWGAWMTPFYLPLPKEDVQFFDFTVEYVDYTGWYECSLKNTPQADALLALLGAAELRQTVRQNSYAVGDTIYDCGLVEPSESIPEVKIRLFPLGGGVSAYADVDGGRYYRILDPEPLLDFLENELSYT